jgi:hypothetical protein
MSPEVQPCLQALSPPERSQSRLPQAPFTPSHTGAWVSSLRLSGILVAASVVVDLPLVAIGEVLSLGLLWPALACW